MHTGDSISTPTCWNSESADTFLKFQIIPVTFVIVAAVIDGYRAKRISQTNENSNVHQGIYYCISKPQLSYFQSTK